MTNIQNKIYRPWGYYEVISNTADSLTKMLYFTNGKAIRKQKHHHRSEHWLVKFGTGILFIDGIIIHIKSGDIITIPVESVHLVRAITNLVILETQISVDDSKCSEDDIEIIPSKVLVTGCFDLLHSGHIQFIENASGYGNELYVGICSDYNYLLTKQKNPVYTEQERKYLIEHINCVNGCIINNGSGKADFENVIESINPNILVTNSDGDTDEKRKLCKKYNIEYVVLDRENYYSNILPSRSSTKIKEELKQ